MCFVFQLGEVYTITCIGDHAQEGLAKFGQSQRGESRKNQDSSYNLATCWKLFSKYGNLRFSYSHNVATCTHFSPPKKNTLCTFRTFLFFSRLNKTLLPTQVSLRRRILDTRIYPVKPRCENRAFPSSFTYLILHDTVSCEWVERRRSRAKRELRSPASALSPLVAAVWDPRTQPQHAQLLQGQDFLSDLKNLSLFVHRTFNFSFFN